VVNIVGIVYKNIQSSLTTRCGTNALTDTQFPYWLCWKAARTYRLTSSLGWETEGALAGDSEKVNCFITAAHLCWLVFINTQSDSGVQLSELKW